jgi:hypothetical protein
MDVCDGFYYRGETGIRAGFQQATTVAVHQSSLFSIFSVLLLHLRYDILSTINADL